MYLEGINRIYQEKMKIAIDFDGTIVEDAYPDIGKPMLFAFETMKELQTESSAYFVDIPLGRGAGGCC
jgi:hypothetical protein